MSYDVARRTRDIGIRMALGADGASMLLSELGQASAIAAGGLALGLVGAWLTSGMVSDFLFGLTARDPYTLGAAALALLTTAMLAGYFPARRAARVDPVVALRAE